LARIKNQEDILIITKMKHILPLLILTCSFLSCGENFIKPSAQCTNDIVLPINSNHPKAAAIQAKMEEYVASGLPGMSILIADSSGIWYSSIGWADIENEISMELCHINKLGSVTKMMVGALAWMLVEDGSLDINEEIGTYIPEVANQITNGDDITVAMLLQHASGIVDIGRDLTYSLAVVNDFARSWTPDEILEFIANKPANFLPGEDIRYSNTNTMLVGMIIEAITGKPHGDLLQERIFQPLAMNNTVYYDYSETFPYDRLAQGYLDFNNDGGAIQNISNLNPGSGNGYTGVYSTVDDLYRFMKAFMVDKTLISEASLTTIINSIDDYEAGWTSIGGLLWEFHELGDDKRSYGHAGGDIGYSANCSYFPHNNTIFVATYNYGGNLPTELSAEMWSFQGDFARIMSE
jgi:D-alanyl-D-alanine carboxypeptidase